MILLDRAQYGMKRDFNKWLASLALPHCKTLTESANTISPTPPRHPQVRQSQLDISDEWTLTRIARATRPTAKDLDLAGAKGIDATLKENNLDALLFPGAQGRPSRRSPDIHRHCSFRIGRK